MALPNTIINAFKKIVGNRNVLTEEPDLLLYSYDSAIDRALPSAVLFPETTQQIADIVKICHQNKIPFVARGAGTNLCGGAVPLHHAVVIAPTRMKRIISVDPEKRTAVVEPGLPNLFLKKHLEPYGLYYAPDPASQKACTIGGNIGTNAGGPHCLKYGVTSHHILGLEVIFPDGEIVEFNVQYPGYDLTGLMVGSEGTLGIVTKAIVNLLPIPKTVETMLVSFPSLEAAVQTVTDIISAGIIPATLEAMDKITVNAVEAFIHAGYPLEAEAVLIIEVDDNGDLKDQVEQIKNICEKNSAQDFRLAKDEKEREKLWEGRRGSYPALARLAPNVLVEDGAVPRNRLPEATRRIRAIAKEDNINVSLIFHAGDGNLHPQILFDERDHEQTRRVKAAGYKMLKACVELGGTISGEHGIGIDKREAMRWLFTPETLTFFRKIKTIFDPANLCNPDKLIPLAETAAQYTSHVIPEKAGILSPVNVKSPDSGYLPLQGESGMTPEKVLSASNERDIKSLFSYASQHKKKIFIQGSGSHSSQSVNCDHTLSTLALNKIIEHDAENFTIIVQAGIRIAELQDFLKSKNQKVFLHAQGTIGGVIASNSAQNPRIRDQILGMKIILADGSTAELGAKVMKNVAGYDAAKLFLGSWGTLGVIVSVILKTFPFNYPIDVKPMSAGVSKSLPQNVKNLHQRIRSALDPESIFVNML